MSDTITPEELEILRAQIEYEMSSSRVDWNAKPVPSGKTVHDYSPIISITPSSVGSSADISSAMPPVWDQGLTDTCVSVATCNAVQYYFSSRNMSIPQYSYLFVYYNARVLWRGLPLRNTDCPDGDCGSTIRHTITAINTYGICLNGSHPWDPSHINFPPPSPAAYNEGLDYNQVFTFIKLVYDLDVLRCVLYFLKVPIIFGFIIYDSYKSDYTLITGNIRTPPIDGDTCRGSALPPNQTCTMGHAVLLTGYDDDVRLFSFQNSYGYQWGTATFPHGFGTMGYDYVMNPTLAQWDDIWIVGPSRVLEI